jgi:PAS domain S-box-containing protein
VPTQSGTNTSEDFEKHLATSPLLTPVDFGSDNKEFWFSQAVLQTNEAVTVCNVLGQVVFVNHAAELLYGYAPGTMAGIHVDSFNAHKDHSTDKIISDLFKNGSWVGDIHQKKQNGKVFVSLLSLFLLRDRNGEITGICSFSRDVSHDRTASEQLKKSRTELETNDAYIRGVVDCVPCYFFWVDEELQLKGMNSKMRDEFLLLVDSMPYCCISDIPFLKDSHFESKLREFLRSQLHLCEVDFDFALPNTNEFRSFHFTLTKFPKSAEILIVGVETTQQKRVQTQLETERARLVASSKMSTLGEMAAGIAHEINNPLAIIMGRTAQAKMLLDCEELNLPMIKQVLSKIDAVSHRIATIVSGLKTFAREGSCESKIPVPLIKIIEETLELCQSRFKAHGIQLELPVALSACLKVTCRSVQISQVLLNLLQNAFDAVAATTDQEEERWVKIAVDLDKEWITLSVTNSGPIIEKAAVDRIFEPFFTTKPLGKGTGLGLSISKGIVEDHGGKLFVDLSKSFTTFAFVLKASQEDEHEL